MEKRRWIKMDRDPLERDGARSVGSRWTQVQFFLGGKKDGREHITVEIGGGGLTFDVNSLIVFVTLNRRMRSECP